MKTITVLSGKGGVGKSSITAALAEMIAQKHTLVCADCDVDASNLHLLFGGAKEENRRRIATNEVALIDHDVCDGCGLCARICYFEAITMHEGKAMVKAHGCEGCGACVIACPKRAIRLQAVENATISTIMTTQGFTITSAQLDPGMSGSGKVVSQVKDEAIRYAQGKDYLLIDAAAGIGCPVIASVAGSDYCVVIIEPTIASLTDAKRAIKVVEHFAIPFGLIINKSDLHPEGAQAIRCYAQERGIPLLGELPYDVSFSQAIRERTPITTYDKSYKGLFTTIVSTLLQQVNV